MDYETILNEAHDAASAAALTAAIRHPEHGGACGFAWVTIDGNSPLARYCRKQLKDGNTALNDGCYGDKGYPSGWQFWSPGGYGGQRVGIEEAAARAFRDVLAIYGIRATVGSRLD